MTELQKEKIALMRSKGVTYANIADNLGLNVNTVKSYCHRNDINSTSKNLKRKNKIVCAQCKQPMEFSVQPSRRFCSDSCRMAWWKAHPQKINRKAIYHFTCPICKKAFTVYGNNKRKYCSRKC